ncbi:hypothetical protein ACSBLW_10040 [Thioclava sp. FR2]|uniref:hypothetical protein n=1 Tax=Thioclava sp. FR2 TaxID=3445780 RepID=UPI003EBFCE8B
MKVGETSGVAAAARGKAGAAVGLQSGGYDYRLTAAALVFAAAVFLFIYFGG